VRHPVPGARVSQPFGAHPGTYAAYGLAGHEGTDYAVPIGTPVRAAHDGTATVRLGSATYGNYVTVQSEQVDTLYAHLSRVDVAQGQAVAAGDIIGLSGNTGRSFGPHLHFGVRPVPVDKDNGFKGWVNPEAFLGGEEQEGYMLSTLHFQRVPDWANGVLRDWRSGWVKVVNPAPGLSFPDVPYLCARWWTDDRDAAYIREGREGGARFVRDMLPTWRGVQATCYELCNEPDANSNDGLAALNTYTIGAIEEAERQGIRLCVLNLAEGNPHDNGGGGREVETWKWAQLAPAVKRAVQGGHFLGRHCYWRPGVEGPDGRWHALGRLRWDIETLGGLGVDVARLKVLVNECGIDGGIARGPAQQGWRDLSHPDAYRAELVEMERYARTIPQIQACMVFTAGFEEPWGGFDVDEGFARSLTAPLRALGSTLPITPIEEEEPVQAYELDAARDRMNRLPATMKACDARGYVFRDEWYSGGHFYCLAWNPFTSRYHTLKLETRGWSVVEDAAL
jgi:hypothetical protein